MDAEARQRLAVRARAFVLAESDPAHAGGLVHEMNRAADLLDIPRLP